MATRAPDEEEPQTFTWPLLGALYGSLVVVAVIAILESHLGRGLEDEIDAPARTLIAVPVVITAVVVFVASMVALVLPAQRRPALRVAEVAGWLIPAWLIIGAMVLGAISFALGQAD
jgi:alkylhydroperoxidase family enzyme